MTYTRDEWEPEKWIKALKDAGWKSVTRFIWRAPNGTLHLGPAGAFKKIGLPEATQKGMPR